MKGRRKKLVLIAVCALSSISCSRLTAHNQRPPGLPTPEGVPVGVNESGLKLTIPPGWKLTNEKGKYRTITPDNALTVVFFASSFDQFSDASFHSGDEVARFVHKAKLSGPGEPVVLRDKLNAIRETGTGEVAGKTVMWSSLIVAAPKKPLQVILFAEENQFKSHVSDLGRIIMAIEKQ